MEMSPYVEELKDRVIAAANHGELSQEELEQIVEQIDPAIRLTLLQLVSAVVDEISAEFAPDLVEVRLRAMDPEIVVSRAGTALVARTVSAIDGEVGVDADGSVSRMTLRMSERLKQRIEQAAAAESLSVNSWLVRLISQEVDQRHPPGNPPPGVQHLTGWAH